MVPTCNACGGEQTYVRAQFDLWFPAVRLVMDEVPAVRCEACDRNEPAAHVRPQFDAVIALAEDVHGATMRKSFARAPLHPEAAGP